MAFEADEIFFNRARWRLAILIPAWLVSLALSLSLISIFTWRIAETVEDWEDSGKRGNIPQVELTWECTNVAFSLVSLVLTIIEISKYATETLTPFFLLCTQLVKITLALADLALDIVAYLNHDAGVFSPIGLAIDVVQIAVIIASLIYAVHTHRRILHFEEYQMTGGSKFEESYHQESSGGAQALDTVATSSGRARSGSVIHNPSIGYESQTAGLGPQVNQAMGAEFGWNSSPAQSGSVVPRAQSWMSQRGLVIGGDDDDDGSETVRGRYDGARHGHGHARIPSVVVSEHGQQGHEDDDTRALLAHEGAIGERSLDAQYQVHPGARSQWVE